MADIAKYTPINGGNLFSEFKSQFSIIRTRKTLGFAYAFVFVFIAFTVFLAFTPSSTSSSPWFTNIFTLPSTTTASSSSSSSSDHSHFPSIYAYFFPNSSSSNSSLPQNAGSAPQNHSPPHKVEILNPTNATNSLDKSDMNQTSSRQSQVSAQNQTQIQDEVESSKQNQTHIQDEAGDLKPNQTKIPATKSPELANTTANSSLESSSGAKNISANGEKGIAEKGLAKNLTSSLMKKQNNDTNAQEKGTDDLIKSLMNCDLFDGNWVKDDSYPLYKPGSCSLIDEQFNCFSNGRPDNDYHKLKWKPKGCTLPRLDGSHMLEMLRGKRLVFVGDSLNRNMWESLICILRNSVKDKKKVYEEFGRHHFREEASYSFVFKDYKCKVEFFVSPFLVQEWDVDGKNGTKKETLRLDLLSSGASKYKDADIIVFNTGHWWTHEKTSLGKDYYQEGSHVYSDLDVHEAFRKALTTWGRWVDSNVSPKKSLVFFRGYSASHFSGGRWNSGGQCDHETEPIKNDTYLAPYPAKMNVLEKVLKGMKKTPVTYLNVTRMTDYRKDGHPSIYRKQHMSDEEKIKPLHFQDCSHWCLPGVPDIWNEILYAELLVKQRQWQQQKRS
ncbi:protein trichome birefringence-like [Salvia divinorum]|uniref:Protein trichome birefringence-like n=1 Tax=Salvia divinorum TaxID=28513 RepID=A0ABD1H0V5_SALDI